MEAYCTHPEKTVCRPGALRPTWGEAGPHPQEAAPVVPRQRRYSEQPLVAVEFSLVMGTGQWLCLTSLGETAQAVLPLAEAPAGRDPG